MLFWTVFIDGMGTLLYWEVYAAVVIYILLTFGPTFILVNINRGAAFIATFFVQPLFHALGILTFVSLVAPIALGLSEDASWSLPLKFVLEAPGEVAKNACLLVVASILIAFFPILGGFPSFNLLVLGIIATGMVFELAGVEGLSRSDLVPSIWVGLGLLFVGGIVSTLGLIVATMLSGVVASMFGQNADDMAPVISFPVIAALGFVPLLLYLSWLGISFS